ncbi:MAG: hypothetical protein E6Q40_00075 [Cupriavidus sp.]|nr:MAG: hypothetical protein E6Q40_00075 [Cupriavidus sp.]
MMACQVNIRRSGTPVAAMQYPHSSRLRSPTLARLVRLAACGCAAAVLGLAAPAMGGEIEGVRFDDAARLGGKELPLNGTGVRAGFVIKGYVAALYLPERARNATVVLGTSGPKRLQIRPLREVGPDDFIKSLNDGIRENHSELQRRMLAERLAQLAQTMNQVGPARRGDIINIDFTPDHGTIVAVNGIPRGQPIPGEDFYQAVLRIFLGEHPVDRDLKRGLLGD